MKNLLPADLSAAVLAVLVLTGCAPRESAGWQGYLEGEFVHVASPLGGRLERLAVSRGERVEAGARLFTLEQAAEQAAAAARQQSQGAEELSAAIEEIASLADELQSN